MKSYLVTLKESYIVEANNKTQAIELFDSDIYSYITDSELNIKRAKNYKKKR